MKKYMIFISIIFSFILCNQIFIQSMSFDQAINYAKEKGVQDIDLFTSLMQEYDRQTKLIDQKIIEQLISILKPEKLSELTEEEKKQINMSPQEFKQYFAQQMKELTELKKGTKTQESITKESKIEADLLKVLQKRSKSEWFYTGDLLAYILTFRKIILPEGKSPVIQKSSYGRDIVVTDSVKKQLKNPIVHLLSHQQISPTCGLSTLANAYALQDQINQNKKITVNQIRKIAENFFTKFKDRLEKEGLLTCARQGSGIQPNKIISFGKSIDPKVNIVTTMYSPKLGSNQREAILNSIRTNKITNIMLYKGTLTGHFTLASIVNEGNNRYIIYYLDSMNRPIGAGKDEEGEYLQTLDALIERAKNEKTMQPKTFIQKINEIRQSKAFKNIDQEQIKELFNKTFESINRYYADKETEEISKLLEVLKNVAVNKKFEQIQKSLESAIEMFNKEMPQLKLEEYKQQIKKQGDKFLLDFARNRYLKSHYDEYKKNYNVLLEDFNQTNLNNFITTVNNSSAIFLKERPKSGAAQLLREFDELLKNAQKELFGQESTVEKKVIENE